MLWTPGFAPWGGFSFPELSEAQLRERRARSGMFCAGNRKHRALRCCLSVNDLLQIKLLTQICFFSLLPCERSHIQTPNSTKMLGSLAFLSGPSKKSQSQLPFHMKIQNRHFFSLKKLQRSTVRGEAICQGLRSVNNAKQTALQCEILPCAPTLEQQHRWGEGKLDSHFWKAGGWICGLRFLFLGFFLKQKEPELTGTAGT